MDQTHTPTIKISDDKLEAFIVLQDIHDPIDEESIKNLLQAHNITFGIKEEALTLLSSQDHKSLKHLIAQGIPAENGSDSSTVFYFNTTPFIEREPLRREDDSLDYYNKGPIEHVLEGDKIAKMIPPTPGIEGTTVTGETIPAIEGKFVPLFADATIQYSEDDLFFRSLKSGHPILKNNKLNILSLFEVKNIDLSTGNIDYPGDVLVLGDINSGFSVNTKKNLEIRGSVHQAKVCAKGNIVCVGGKILGEEGSLIAGGNITIPFIDGGAAEAGDSLTIHRHIINAQISVNNSILCNQNEGLILGGKLKATNLIETFILGCENETKTEVILNNMTERLARLKEIETTRKEHNKELSNGYAAFKKLEKLIKNKNFTNNMNEQSYKALNTYKQMLDRREKMQQELKDQQKEKEEISTSLKFGASPELYVYGTVFPKTFITINNSRIIIKNALANIKFTAFNNEIQIYSLKEEEENIEKEEGAEEQKKKKEEENNGRT